VKRERVLIDTGPIVAILSEADQHHERCVAELASLRPPLVTCWSVLTEAQWLLRRDDEAVEGLFRAFSSGLLALLSVNADALPWLSIFLRRYSKLHADLADACLVYLAETERIHTVFTLDQRDFSVYRHSRNRRLRIVPAPVY
jgi:predicted nucleic acid-binding protein